MRAGPVGLVVLWVSATAVLTATAWLAVQVVADEVGGAPTRVLSASAVTSAAQGSSQAPRPTRLVEPDAEAAPVTDPHRQADELHAVAADALREPRVHAETEPVRPQREWRRGRQRLDQHREQDLRRAGRHRGGRVHGRLGRLEVGAAPRWLAGRGGRPWTRRARDHLPRGRG